MPDVDPDAWDSLNSATSRPFPHPETKGKIAVKVINGVKRNVVELAELPSGRDGRPRNR